MEQKLCTRCNEKPSRNDSSWCGKCIGEASSDARRRRRQREVNRAVNLERVANHERAIVGLAKEMRDLPMSVEHVWLLDRISLETHNLALLATRMTEQAR